MSETKPTTSRYVTPRGIAWILLLSGSVWFVATSPKNPQQFYDAGCFDRITLDKRTEQQANQIPSKHVQTLQALNSLDRKMDRMTLSYDLIHHPARVQQERPFILLGSYDSSPETHETMIQNNSTYSSLSEQFEKMKMDMKASRDTELDSSVSRQASGENKDLRMKRFQAEMDRMILRQFQAKLFWRINQ